MVERGAFASASLDPVSEAMDALEEGIAIYDCDERLVTFNGGYAALLAPVADELRPGLAWRDLIQICIERGVSGPRHQSGRDWAEVCDELRREGAKRSELRHIDGCHYEISYNPTRSGGFVITRTDVTAKIEAQEQAAERERLLSAILETNPIPIVMTRASDGKIVYNSPAATEMLGGVTDVLSGQYESAARSEYMRLLEEQGRVENFQVKLRLKDRSAQTVSLTGALTEFGGETCVVSSISNLTETLRREAMIRRLVEACPTPLLMNRVQTGEILYKSPSVTDLFGRTDCTKDYWSDIADRDTFHQALKEQDGVTDWRARFLNAKGEGFVGAVSARIIEWAGEQVIVSHVRDLTRELGVEAELDRQRQQSFQNEKMMALGGLMAGVAHELNNPLSVVVGHAMMLQDEARDPEVRRKMEKISGAAERCARIVKAFLTMAREEPLRLEVADANEVIETAVEVARYSDGFGPQVRVVTKLDAGLVPISCDPDQITQVLINLLQNAAQALGPVGGTIAVRSSAVPGHTQIVVEDNGPGVSEELQTRIFEPFFTTKGVGQGTGIGLAMCHRIVAAHQGSIRHEQPETGGARFVVLIPAEHSAEAMPVPLETASARRAATVLVIDDEPEVADMNAEILTRGGYRAEVAYHAGDVSARLEEQSFDAVLSDLNMPDLDGLGVYDVIRMSQPELCARTGFLTGDLLGKHSRSFLGETGRPHIEKPVSPAELRDFVGRLVAGEI